ncbi:unnamed protein product [Calypogeia fissa]
MAKKIWKGYRAISLPLGKETKLTKGFTSRGGELGSFCKEDYDVIIAPLWSDVVDHFAATPKLLEYFYEFVLFVQEEWIIMSIHENALLQPLEFLLCPGDPYAAISDRTYYHDPKPELPKCTLTPEELAVEKVRYEATCKDQWQQSVEAAYQERIAKIHAPIERREERKQKY